MFMGSSSSCDRFFGSLFGAWIRGNIHEWFTRDGDILFRKRKSPTFLCVLCCSGNNAPTTRLNFVRTNVTFRNNAIDESPHVYNMSGLIVCRIMVIKMDIHFGRKTRNDSRICRHVINMNCGNFNVYNNSFTIHKLHPKIHVYEKSDWKAAM